MFLAVIGNNCNTNRKLEILFKKSFVGCFSLRFYIAVQDMISVDLEMLITERKLMQVLWILGRLQTFDFILHYVLRLIT